jgi:hypothetical protein
MSGKRRAYNCADFHDFSSIYEGADIAITTAVRLSSAFPFISPRRALSQPLAFSMENLSPPDSEKLVEARAAS